MEVFEAIKNRYSCRSYKTKPVPEEKLNKVLEAARLAPSAHNAQEWKFIVVKDAGKKEKLSKAAFGQKHIAQASVVIAAVATDPNTVSSSGVPLYAIDLSIALDHMTLMAAAERLGTCWIGGFNQEEVRRVLNIPERYKAVALMPLGFPADKPKKKIRKKLEEIISTDSF